MKTIDKFDRHQAVREIRAMAKAERKERAEREWAVRREFANARDDA